CQFFFFSSRRRHTRFDCDWSSDVCSSDLRPTNKLQNPKNIENSVQTFLRATMPPAPRILARRAPRPGSPATGTGRDGAPEGGGGGGGGGPTDAGGGGGGGPFDIGGGGGGGGPLDIGGGGGP